MVALNQNRISPPPSHHSAPIRRQIPPQNRPASPPPIRLFLRARYYDPYTAEFTSPDPLEYVDGMSLFRGYLGLRMTDPKGTISVVGDLLSKCKENYVKCIADCADKFDGRYACEEHCEFKFEDCIPTPDEERLENICQDIGAHPNCDGCECGKCSEIVASILDAIKKTWILNICGLKLGMNTCERWAKDCHSRLPNLESSPCVTMSVVSGGRCHKNLGLTTDHAWVTIRFCNGKTIHLDNGGIGKDDHIFCPQDLTDNLNN